MDGVRKGVGRLLVLLGLWSILGGCGALTPPDSLPATLTAEERFNVAELRQLVHTTAKPWGLIPTLIQRRSTTAAPRRANVRCVQSATSIEQTGDEAFDRVRAFGWALGADHGLVSLLWGATHRPAARRVLGAV